MKIVVLKSENVCDAMTLFQSVAEDFPKLSAESFKEVLVRNLRRGSVLGVVKDGVLCGVLIYSKALRRIGFLAVLPQARRYGIARALMHEALVRLGGHAELFTYESDGMGQKTPAMALYESLGFSICGRESGFAVPVVRMIK